MKKKIPVTALIKAKFDKALASMFTQEDELEYYLAQTEKAKEEQIVSSRTIIEGALKTKDRLVCAQKTLDNLTASAKKMKADGKKPDDPTFAVLLTKVSAQRQVVESLKKSSALADKAAEDSKNKLRTCELTIANIEAQATVIRSQIETYKTTATYDPKVLNLTAIENALKEMSSDITCKTEANTQVNDILNEGNESPETVADNQATFDSL